MFGSLFCCSKKKIISEQKQFFVLIHDCVKEIEKYSEMCTIKQLPKETQDMIKKIYKKANKKFDLDTTIVSLLNEDLLFTLTKSLDRLEKLMNKDDFQEFAKNVIDPFDKSNKVCVLM